MPRFYVAVEVSKLYTVEVEASDSESAEEMVDNMEIDEIYENGSLGDTSADVYAVEQVVE